MDIKQEEDQVRSQLREQKELVKVVVQDLEGEKFDINQNQKKNMGEM